ncbi:MAG: hypothetical protein LQ338_000028 [Usnochroma carphineum]|nr:MAG: hypothetical protein LQ338_000028 [Usnochroma carphineum]
MDSKDPKQALMPIPPKAITFAIAGVNFCDEEIAKTVPEFELLNKFNAVHGGWFNVVPSKKQSARKTRGKKPERNWQAARQNGPRPLVIGKGKKVGVKPELAIQKPKWWDVVAQPMPGAKDVGRFSYAKALSTVWTASASTEGGGSTISSPPTSVADDLSIHGEKIAWDEDVQV